jgi:hypothetical protein
MKIMRGRHTSGRSRDLLSLGGWLFADLLLALAMLFFTTSIIVQPAHPVHIKPTPTPKVQPPLELIGHRIMVTIDAAGILNNSSAAIQSVEREIRGMPILRHRSAGLVVAYGGSPTVYQINTAVEIADKIYTILGMLGKTDFVFTHSKFYDSLFRLGMDENTVILDIFLFSR